MSSGADLHEPQIQDQHIAPYWNTSWVHPLFYTSATVLFEPLFPAELLVRSSPWFWKYFHTVFLDVTEKKINYHINIKSAIIYNKNQIIIINDGTEEVDFVFPRFFFLCGRVINMDRAKRSFSFSITDRDAPNYAANRNAYGKISQTDITWNAIYSDVNEPSYQV